MDSMRKPTRSCGQKVVQQKTTIKRGCSSKRTNDKVQTFPQTGILADNTDLPIALLSRKLRQEQSQVCSYIVRTVNLNHDTGTFEQTGSAPNFQADVLTLCTCKHQMRSTRTVDEWNGMWIAGFTSRTKQFDGKHWLFYLAKIEAAYESHTRLWHALPLKVRNAKAAHVHYLGDVFRPQTQIPEGNEEFSLSQYIAPGLHAHRQHPGDSGWHKDINYLHATSHRRPPLLVADPQNTYLWHEPVLYLNQDHCRDFSKWNSLRKLFAQLQEVGR